MRQLDLRVANLDCEHDAARLQRGLAGTPGVDVLQVFASSGKLRVRLDELQTPVGELERRLASIGFPVVKEHEPAGPPRPWKNLKVLASAASGLLFAAGWLLSWLDVPPPVAASVYLLSVLIGGFYFGREAVQELYYERGVGIEMLMSTAAVLAFTLGQTGEAAMLVFLYSISEALEGYTEEKTRGAIRALMKLAPKVAIVRREGRELEVPVEEIAPGDVFLVRPGAAVPTDGAVISGRSSVNQAPITGESAPVDKGPGEPVFAASINGEGALEVRATKAFADNTLSRIIHLVEEAQEQKGRSHRFIERFGRVYSPAILVVGALLAVLPPLLFGREWGDSVIRSTVFIVAGAPCALAISVPITFVAALGTAARRGVLIKGGVHLEDLARVRVVAFDKTGTLTVGKPEVTDVLPVEAASSDELLSLAAAVEANSEHPLARAVVRKAEAAGLAFSKATDFQSTTGMGASARVDGRLIRVGNIRAFAGATNLDAASRLSEPLREAGKSVVLVGTEERVLGVLGLRDNLRPRIRDVLDELRREGINRLVMLTGDNATTATAIAREAGIEDSRAELLPEDKVAAVLELDRAHGGVAMVGDGVNDAPALAAATVGIAMGAAGTDVALETADVALMADDLGKIAEALRIAHRTRRLVWQNLALSALVISVLVVGAVVGAFGLPAAVVAHEVSEFVVIANGLRMLRAG